VEAFVREHWVGGYASRFAYHLSRGNEAPELVSIEGITCRMEFETPACRFQIGARFASGDLHFLEMGDQFRWNRDGRLEMTIVIE
jgi:hypothetical protein